MNSSSSGYARSSWPDGWRRSGPVTEPAASFVETRRGPRYWLVALIVLAHLLALYGLVRIFAPDAVGAIERTVLSTITVTITAPPATPDPAPDEGAAGAAGKEAVPSPVTAPEPRVPVKQDRPLPRASSTGTANNSGAQDSGAGTGASGSGDGPGSGRGGGGQGGVAATKPIKIAGEINSAADFPMPPGGRQARFGNRVVVYMTVGTDGRATGCYVRTPSPDAEADAIVCRLAEQRFRFRPATDSQGNPVASTYGWQQKWFAR